MKKIYLIMILLSLGSLARSMTAPRCTTEQTKAFEMMNFTVARAVAYGDLAANVAATVVAASSPNMTNTWTWTWFPLGTMFLTHFSVPNCSWVIIDGEQINWSQIELNVKNRWSFYLTLSSQVVALANTTDSNNRNLIGGIIGFTILSRILFETQWHLHPKVQAQLMPLIDPQYSGLALRLSY